MSVNDAKKLADKLFPVFDDDDVSIVDIPQSSAGCIQKLMIFQYQH